MGVLSKIHVLRNFENEYTKKANDSDDEKLVGPANTQSFNSGIEGRRIHSQ
jgi:hypothetical protein